MPGRPLGLSLAGVALTASARVTCPAVSQGQARSRLQGHRCAWTSDGNHRFAQMGSPRTQTFG